MHQKGDLHMSFHHRLSRVLSAFAGILLLSGCAETELISHYAKKLSFPSEERTAGTYKVGNAYKVGNVWYYPQEDFGFSETGIASWYGPDFHGKRTANGEIYDQNELTAAHRTLQMPSFVRVTNLENGRSVVVRINDRGPFKRGRVIDVSKKAADLLDFRGRGTARVRVEVLEKASKQAAAAAKRGMNTSRMALADFDKDGAAQPVAKKTVSRRSRVTRGPQFASLQSDIESLPESLQTPTITVEELSAPSGSGASYQEPAPMREEPSKAQPQPKKIAGYTDPLAGYLDQKGRFMPEPVVSSQPVSRTGIFVQAGSFAVYENAERLSVNLGNIAQTSIEPVTVKGRQLYRVKLGPIASVAEADNVLDQVIRAGNETAKVIRN